MMTPLFILLVSMILFIVFDVLRTRQLIRVGTSLTKIAKAYERPVPGSDTRILVIGDSSAVGVGSDSNEYSIAGRLAVDYPEADVTNMAVSGSRVRDAIDQLKALASRTKYDLVLIQIGGNDIVRRTPLSQLDLEIPQLLTLALQHGKRLVHLTSGNVGTSKLLPLGTRWFFTLRTKQVRKLFMRHHANLKTTYVDLFRKRSVDPYAQDPKKYYSPDFFHPSAEGYGDWYTFVKPAVENVLHDAKIL